MLVLTGIDFSTKETMYKQSQESLRKFFWDIHVENAWTGLNMREGEHRNDFLAAGFEKYGCKQTKPGRYGNRKINGLCSKNGLRKRINPVGADGNRLLCICCGSYRHLLKDCPDSWENIEKRDDSFEKQMKPMNQSIKETTKCTEGSGAGPEPEMQGTFRDNIAGFMAEMDSMKKEIDNVKNLLKERRVEEEKQVENVGKQKNSECIKSLVNQCDKDDFDELEGRKEEIILEGEKERILSNVVARLIKETVILKDEIREMKARVQNQCILHEHRNEQENQRTFEIDGTSPELNERILEIEKLRQMKEDRMKSAHMKNIKVMSDIVKGVLIQQEHGNETRCWKEQEAERQNGDCNSLYKITNRKTMQEVVSFLMFKLLLHEEMMFG